MILTVTLNIPDSELARLNANKRQLAEGVVARLHPVAGCDPDEFTSEGVIASWYEGHDRKVIRVES